MIVSTIGHGQHVIYKQRADDEEEDEDEDDEGDEGRSRMRRMARRLEGKHITSSFSGVSYRIGSLYRTTSPGNLIVSYRIPWESRRIEYSQPAE